MKYVVYEADGHLFVCAKKEERKVIHKIMYYHEKSKNFPSLEDFDRKELKGPLYISTHTHVRVDKA